MNEMKGASRGDAIVAIQRHQGGAAAAARRRREASCGDICKLWCMAMPVVMLNATKAVVTTFVPGVVLGAGLRTLAMFGFHRARDVHGGLAVYGAVLFTTAFALDETLGRAAIARNRAFIGSANGTASADSGRLKDAVLATLPSMGGGSFVLYKFVKHQWAAPFAAHLVTQAVCARLQRIGRDTGAQFFFSVMPSIKVTHADGRALTFEESEALDNTRFGSQKHWYGGLLLCGQFLTALLRTRLGAVEAEYGEDPKAAFVAMFALLIASKLIEGLDEFNGVFAKIWHATKLGYAVSADWAGFRFLPADFGAAWEKAKLQGSQRMIMGWGSTDMVNFALAVDSGKLGQLAGVLINFFFGSETEERGRWAVKSDFFMKQREAIHEFACETVMALHPELRLGTGEFGTAVEAAAREATRACRHFNEYLWPEPALVGRLRMMSDDEREALIEQHELPTAPNPLPGQIEALSGKRPAELEPSREFPALRSRHGRQIHTQLSAREVLQDAGHLGVCFTEAQETALPDALARLVQVHAEAGWGNQASLFLRSCPTLHLTGLVCHQFAHGSVVPIAPFDVDLRELAPRMDEVAHGRREVFVGVAFPPTDAPLEAVLDSLMGAYARSADRSVTDFERVELQAHLPGIVEFAAHRAGWGRYARDWIIHLSDERKRTLVEHVLSNASPALPSPGPQAVAALNEALRREHRADMIGMETPASGQQPGARPSMRRRTSVHSGSVVAADPE